MPLPRPDRVAIGERVALAAARLGLALPPLPVPFFDAWLGPVAARAVMAATSLGVIEALGERPDDAAGLSRRLDITEEGADLLLGALVTLGYAKHRRGRFVLTRMARRWLTAAGPRPIDRWVGSFAYDSWDWIGRLEEVLQGGQPADLHERDPSDPLWERYQTGIEQLARLTAEPVAKAIPAEHPSRLLDLAGGQGVHAAAMCRRHPGLQATVVELETPARLGREAVQCEGMADRIEYLAADLFTADLGSGYDVVTAHSILHNLDRERSVELLRRARAALRPGGLAAALELDRPERGRAGSSIPALNALIFHVAGNTRTWTGEEVRAMFEEAEFERVELLRPLALSGSLIAIGRRG